MVARFLLPLAFVMALFGSASAEKARLAVLGLEVAGSVDTYSTGHGRLLTEMFRGRVNASPRFMQAPNSHKDLLDEKVASGCDSEAPDCMSKIGAKMKAQLLIYGKIEKRPKDKLEGYQVSMKSLDIEKRTVKEWGDWIPLSDFADGKLDARVTRGFELLTKDDSAGTMGGSGTIVVPPPKVTPKKSGFPWKVTAYAATGVTVAMVGGLVYSALKINKTERNCPANENGGAFDQESTYQLPDGMPRPDLGSGYDPSRCAKDGPKYARMSWITGLGAAAIGGFALFAYYEGFVAKKEGRDPNAGVRVKKKKSIAVTPIVSPDGAGATVRIDW